MGFDQIFTILSKFHNTGIPGIVGIPGVRAVSQCLRCFYYCMLLHGMVWHCMVFSCIDTSVQWSWVTDVTLHWFLHSFTCAPSRKELLEEPIISQSQRIHRNEITCVFVLSGSLAWVAFVTRGGCNDVLDVNNSLKRITYILFYSIGWAGLLDRWLLFTSPTEDWPSM